jgi:hypothetical protein
MQIEFKSYLINEDNQYFGSKIGDILNAIQELSSDSANMGSRHVTRIMQEIVNQIRSVLRSKWSIQQRPFLEQLQKVGVALMKVMEEKGDIPGTLASAAHTLETVSSKIGTPLNTMGTGLAENTVSR